MSSSISVRSVARCTFAAYAGRATVLLPAVAITVVIVATAPWSAVSASISAMSP